MGARDFNRLKMFKVMLSKNIKNKILCIALGKMEIPVSKEIFIFLSILHKLGGKKEIYLSHM